MRTFYNKICLLLILYIFSNDAEITGFSLETLCTLMSTEPIEEGQYKLYVYSAICL